MTVLFGEAAADFFTQSSLVLRQLHRAKNIFQAREGVVGNHCPALEHVIAALTLHDDGIPSIGGLARLAEAAQKLCECDFHVNQIIR